jgi:hypothetical protein
MRISKEFSTTFLDTAGLVDASLLMAALAAVRPS